MAYAYITNDSGGTVSVIDTTTNTVSATINVGSVPYGSAVSPDGSKAYITNNSSGNVNVIDTSTNTVSATITVGTEPTGVAVTPDGTKAYVTNFSSNSVSVIDTSTNTVSATITGVTNPIGVAVTPDGNSAYVAATSGTNGAVVVINTSTDTVVATITGSSLVPFVQPYGIAITPDGRYAYVADNGTSDVFVINTSTHAVEAFITVPNRCFAVAITPDGSSAYVTSNLNGNTSIYVINTSDNTVAATITTSNPPYGVAITPDGKSAYVATSPTSGNGSVIAINVPANTIAATITVGTRPTAFGQFIKPSTSSNDEEFMNKLRNGTFDIWQRGTSGSVAAGNSAYTADGWIVGATGAAVSWAQSLQLADTCDIYALKLTGASGLTDVYLKQRIESYLAAQLLSKDGNTQAVTFQIKFYNGTNSSITPKLTVSYATSQDNFSSLTTDLNLVSLQSCAAGVWTDLAYTWTPASANYANGVEVSVDLAGALNAATNNLAYFEVADLRPTPGVATGKNSYPPVPELRPTAIELVSCQRYFNSTFGNGVAPAQNAGLSGALSAQAYGTSAGDLYAYWQFPSQMRANPTITTYNPSASNANWRDVSGSSDVTVSVDPDSAKGVAGVVIASQTTALAAGHRCYIHATASAEL